MKEAFKKYFSYFSNKKFVWSFILSFALLAIAIVIDFYATIYATKVASSPVTDIVLSNIRVYDVDAIFVYGPWIFWIFTFILIISKPYRIPFAINNITLFVLIRSVFITLTHIGPFPIDSVLASGKIISQFTSDVLKSGGGDLFFSAHTGLPYLMALVFWKNKILRYIMLFSSVFFGVIVLLGHYHYTIDVVSAFFITYSIYSIAKIIFKKDMEYFYHDTAKN